MDYWPLPLEKISRDRAISLGPTFRIQLLTAPVWIQKYQIKDYKISGINELRSFDRACAVQNIETK